ncbi:MAG: SidA/IucD/PvdA family monooxygenase, partial [Bacteroidota bacterium]
TENGVLNARRVILAVGNTEQPCWPGWARALRTAGRRVDHLFDAGFDRSAIPEDERVAVIGGGISAAQAAAALSRRGPTLLVARHATRVHQLDADPGWLGPKHMDAFHRERSLAVRRETINGARNRGSVSPNVLRSVKRAVRLGGLARMTAEVEAADAGPLNTAHLKLRRPDGTMTTLVVDRIVLATGFETSRPGGAWLDEAVGVEELPLAPCGFPRLRASLEWAPELYAAGPLAELQLGPTARNIAGARAAAQRLPAA